MTIQIDRFERFLFRKILVVRVAIKEQAEPFVELEQQLRHRLHHRSAEANGVDHGAFEGQRLVHADELLGIRIDEGIDGTAGGRHALQIHEHDVVPQPGRTAIAPGLPFFGEMLLRTDFHDAEAVERAAFRHFDEQDVLAAADAESSIQILHDDDLGIREDKPQRSLDFIHLADQQFRMGDELPGQTLLQLGSCLDGEDDDRHARDPPRFAGSTSTRSGFRWRTDGHETTLQEFIGS